MGIEKGLFYFQSNPIDPLSQDARGRRALERELGDPVPEQLLDARALALQLLWLFSGLFAKVQLSSGTTTGRIATRTATPCTFHYMYVGTYQLFGATSPCAGGEG